MEKEIKKRAQLYGIAAIVSAIVLTAFVFSFGVYPPEYQPPAQMLLNTFSSDSELINFLKANSRIQGSFPFYGPWDANVFRGNEATFGSFTAQVDTAESLKIQYSPTNIQVAGVDEADVVKTDGEYIYLVSGNNVTIVKAYPAEQAEVVSKITFTDKYPVGIFVSGNRLVVLGSRYVVPYRSYYQPYVIDIKTFVHVYDISERTQPTLLRDFTITGSYFNSRMIGDYVYFVVSQPAYIVYDTVILPTIYSNDAVKKISASEISYTNTSDNYYMFTTVVALNMQQTSEEPNYKTIMLGGTSTMYVSLGNIYVTFPEPDEKTSIYRISIEGRIISFEANGKVPGRELNQFSMDEYNNYFRIATTSRFNATTQNNVYILDMDLNIIGSLENIAPGEAIDSARFIGNRCYLATSVVKRDPFFVIDLKNATDPEILGYLKIPGFTRYLHPYDDGHVIGVGKDGNIVKISVFDVRNVSAPIEVDKFTVEGAWSDSSVLTDPKAFLFDKSKELLVIPVLVSYGWEKYSLWQGVYVFNITSTGWLDLRGGITHLEDDTNGWNSLQWVKRTLYIENVLYTVSDKKIKMNSLEDLTLINTIEFP